MPPKTTLQRTRAVFDFIASLCRQFCKNPGRVKIATVEAQTLRTG